MTSEIGRLQTTSTNASGKKVDEWRYHSPFGKTHRCVVKIFSEGAHSMLFKAFALREGADAVGVPWGGELEVFQPISDTDINRLKERVLAAYRAYDEVANGVTWENWIEVQVALGAGIWGHDEGESIAIKHRVIKRTTLADGSQITINANGFVNEFPQPKAQGAEDELPNGVIGSKRDKKSEYAYFPATRENLEAVLAMAAGIKELTARVATFIRQAGANGRIDTTGFTALPPLTELD